MQVWSKLSLALYYHHVYIFIANLQSLETSFEHGDMQCNPVTTDRKILPYFNMHVKRCCNQNVCMKKKTAVLNILKCIGWLVGVFLKYQNTKTNAPTAKTYFIEHN